MMRFNNFQDVDQKQDINCKFSRKDTWDRQGVTIK